MPEKSKKIPTKKQTPKITKKLRFEVFKRDGFACQYCGKMPPSVTLEIDHINPRSKGGNNDINNLITACFDCNRGKTNIPLTKIPNSLQENLEILKEQENQLKEYNKFIKKIEKRLLSEAAEVSNIYGKYFPDWGLSEHFKKNSLKTFSKSLSKQEINDSMELACTRIDDKDKAIKYFCGICWNKIKSKTDPLYDTVRELKKYWEKQPRGSGYLKEELLRDWIDKYGQDKIKERMDEARGLWSDLKNFT